MADVDVAHDGSPADAAPADTAKRRQILDGASRLFMSLGFNGASMGEIARAAEVSKGTLYVYFQNKEQLFEACIEEKRRLHFDRILDFDPALPIDQQLTRYGTTLATFVTSPAVIMAMQTVIGIAEQMPDLGRRFYDQGPARGARAFAEFLDRRVTEGVLDIEDTSLAAVQFIDMCQSSLVRPLLFGRALTNEERDERIPKVVAGAVSTFLKAYRSSPAGSGAARENARHVVAK
jgi:TetR/AcrR family transcriptional regulator of autoinduction and epiphytic fitness